jgi:predicted aspartyl protease
MRMSRLAQFFVGFALLATVEVAFAAASPSSLKTFLERQGFGGSPLHRRLGNHLFAATTLNGRPAALMIDSGCPFTLIDRASAERIVLPVKETGLSVRSVFGKPQRYGISELRTLAMGNCTFTNVPVQIADKSEINGIRGPHLDGLFGAHEMVKFGMVVDCARQMIYVNPGRPTPATASGLADFLHSRGFVRIPMHKNARDHLEIAAAINGRPARLIVDTGAATTLVAYGSGASSGLTWSARGRRTMRRAPHYPSVAVGSIRELTLGELTVHDAEVVMADVLKQVGDGFLGEEYLTSNFAVIDFGGMSLYLRRPDRP